MKYDRELTWSTATSRFSTHWQNGQILWSQIVERLRVPTKTGETQAQYRAMSKAEKGKRKDLGGFVGGYIVGGRRNSQSIKYREIISLDADEPCIDFLDKLDNSYAWCLYSTHGHSVRSPRYRLLIPLDRKVNVDEYQAIARKIAASIDIESMDITTYEPSRLMYFPTISVDGEYVFRVNDMPIVSADDILATYENWQDVSTWATSSKEARVIERSKTKQSDPLSKAGVVGAFCRAYTIQDAIATFLSTEYRPCTTENRFTYIKGTSYGGAVVYDDKFLFSHHATDPCSGELCNAFDLVRLHLFKNLDNDARPNTPVNRLKSFSAMIKFALQDKKVKAELSEALKNDLKDSLLEEVADVDPSAYDWLNDLERGSGKNAEVLNTAFNVKLILSNDILLKDKFGLDDFAHRLVVKGKLPWAENFEGQKFWTDSDDSCLRNYISDKYKITGKQVIDDALTEVMQNNKFNPVKDYLNSLSWDGLPRLENVFISFLGADNSKYVKDVTKLQTIAAIARIFNPGRKYDYCVVLSGGQGIGKSTILNKLGKKWFNDSIVSFQGKDPLEQLQGSWIIELSEMQASNRADNEQIKAFLTKQEDKFRAPYGRRTEYFPRQCVFFATTNEAIFLKDRTGSRRFLPIFCEGERLQKLDELTEDYMDQIWAEAYHEYIKFGDKPLILPEDSEKVARELQTAHTEGQEKIGLILQYLDTPLPDNWDNMDLYQRRAYLEEYDPDNELAQKGTHIRDTVCSLEVFYEGLRGDKKNYSSAEIREINTILKNLDGWGVAEEKSKRVKLYGIQRVYRRKK